MKESEAMKNEIRTVLDTVSQVSNTVDRIWRVTLCWYLVTGLLCFMLTDNAAQHEERIRNWFYEGQPSRHDTIQADFRRFKGNLETGQWFLNSREFKSWERYPQQTLWLHGPGWCWRNQCRKYSLTVPRWMWQVVSLVRFSR